MAEHEIDLQEKFPDLKPIRSAPSLFTVNGCGLMMYGARDYDVETDTYVKTQCLTFIFVPLLSVRAYRVANAEQGWYFIGREPLSAFARIWNAFLVVGVLAAVGIGSWAAHTRSPEYVARQDLEQAQQFAETGDWRKAAGIYVKVINSQTSSAAVARSRIDKLFADAAKTVNAEDGLALVAMGDTLRHQAINIADLEAIALKIVARHAKTSPRTSFEILRVADRLPIVPEAKTAEFTRRRMQMRETVLVALLAVEKDAVDAASELAVIRESQGKFDECRTLLEPLAARLGDAEGARVLGQIYARKGEIEKAHRLLVPYCKQRLKSLHEAEKRFRETYRNAYVSAESRVIGQLKAGNAPANFTNQMRAADKDGRVNLLREYVSAKVRDDVRVADARRELQSAGRIVSVALDLGMVLLRRSRTLKDAAARQKELKQAEETFLAVRGLAGETEQFQLFLGQVYYWMGREREGRPLFDKFLEKRQRDYRGLMLLSSTLRSLGASGEARKLAEEAYKKAATKEDRESAALLRALLFTDIDEKIVWLRRADRTSPPVEADLNTAQGYEAERDGRNTEAAAFYRKAIAIYERMPATSSTFNNGGLVWLALHRVTGDKADFDNGLKRIEMAVALSPSDSVVLQNSASTLYEAAAADIIGKSLNLPALQLNADLELLRYLYRDEQERAAWIQRVAKHAGMKRAREYFEKVMLLAPKNAGSYYRTAMTLTFLNDVQGLKALLQRLRAANVETDDYKKAIADYIQGKDLDKTRRRHRVDAARMRKIIQTWKGPRDATYAIACSRLSGDLIGLGTIGDRVDAAEIVKLADDAHKAAPSSGTRRGLLLASAFRALTTLAGKGPVFESLVKRHRRSMDSLYLLAALVRHHDAARTALKDDPDLVRIIALERETGQAFPSDRAAVEWALLSRLHPDEAARVAEAVRKDDADAVYWQFLEVITPGMPTWAMDAYWKAELTGHPADGTKIVEHFHKLGVELPVAKP